MSNVVISIQIIRMLLLRTSIVL